MGLARFIKHILLPQTYPFDIVENMKKENDVVKGIKKTIKDDFTEDNPLTSVVYKAGKYDGKKEGYTEAAGEYEKKLLDQADKFITQKKIYENEMDQYESLLDEYEAAIVNLTEKVDRTTAENELLQELLLKDRKLRIMNSKTE